LGTNLTFIKTVLWTVLAATLLIGSQLLAEDHPRVFITDSTSWETRGSAGGSGGVWAASTHGGARPQTAEIIKTFGQRCPNVLVNNKQEMADYVVVLDHEGGKGWLQHRNKVAVFNAVSGDSVVSKSTLSLGGSVQEACEAIAKHWSEHGAEIRAEASKAKEKPASSAPTTVAAAPAAARVSVASNPDGADIEIDGSFVGNTPSVIELAPGEHTVTVTKSGFKPWTRKTKISGGEIRMSADLEKGS
jgi:PEGA domain